MSPRENISAPCIVASVSLVSTLSHAAIASRASATSCGDFGSPASDDSTLLLSQVGSTSYSGGCGPGSRRSATAASSLSTAFGVAIAGASAGVVAAGMGLHAAARATTSASRRIAASLP
ncbi:hypothetical protein [Nannocystis pusilla]|uniref:hypothetical protein n=1 Tax=Nannocystis pusilla TaxID=889268 RepID=UPI003DA1DC97